MSEQPLQHALSQPSNTENWEIAVGRYFKPAEDSSLPWPTIDFMVSQRHKVLYAPLAKCACTSLKTMMIHLAEIPHTDLITKHGVHQTTGRFKTGIKLRDLEVETSSLILDTTDWFKFAVIRDPVERLISAYTEKFIINRMDSGNIFHTRPIVKAMQATESPDYETGITFRQFFEFIAHRPEIGLDPHWAPQHLYLRGVNSYDRLYRVNQIGELKTDLEDFTGEKISLDWLNQSAASQTAKSKEPSVFYVDELPKEIEARGKISSDAFKEPSLVAEIERYYAEDCEIFAASSDPLFRYAPPAPPIQLSWGKVRLYSKGFCALPQSGIARTSIVVTNDSEVDIDENSFAGLQIECQALDNANNPIENALSIAKIDQPIKAASTLCTDITLTVPAANRNDAKQLKITITNSLSRASLTTGLAHIAFAQLIHVE